MFHKIKDIINKNGNKSEPESQILLNIESEKPVKHHSTSSLDNANNCNNINNCNNTASCNKTDTYCNTDLLIERLEDRIRKNNDKRKRNAHKIKEKRDEELEIFREMFYIHILESLAKSNIYGPGHINLSYTSKFSVDYSNDLTDPKDSSKKKNFVFKYNCVHENEGKIVRVVYCILQELKKKKLIKSYVVNTMYDRGNHGDVLIYK